MNYVQINQNIPLSTKEKGILNLLQIENHRAIDLLLNLPYKYVAKKYIIDIKELNDKENIILKVIPIKIDNNFNKLIKIEVEFNGQRNKIELLFFQARIEYIQFRYKIGQEILISGKIEKQNKYFQKKFFSRNKNAEWQIAHPEIIRNPDLQTSSEQINQNYYSEPFYHCIKEIDNNYLKSLFSLGFKEIDQQIKSGLIFPEWFPEKILQKYQWPNFYEALKILHQYEKPEYKIYNTPLLQQAKQRIIFDEFFAKSLGIKFLKHYCTKQEGKIITGHQSMQKQILQSLPFSLTENQNKVLYEQIYTDQSSPFRMMRMLQGDVGSGKTIIALIAMINAIECGFQVALMAPTEILANQHAQYIEQIIHNASLEKEIEIIILTSSIKQKKQKIEKIATYCSKNTQKKQIIIGTHALFQQNIHFPQIGLFIIDEQHRFGVQARQDLVNKDQKTDVLLMSATPIPRSLAMIEYGYMDHSLLTEKPIGRKKIFTSVLNSVYANQLIEKIQQFLNRQEQIYWICPLIEQSSKLDLMAIEQRLNILVENFGQENVAIAHGKMHQTQIKQNMEEFTQGQKKILLATTVVEVGVNVANASLIIIEDAQRFGLAQLHQLRGRVGRSNQQSYCILLYNRNQTSKETLHKLKNVADTEDGFAIAQMDLKYRGYGELSGLKQSGFNQYLIGNLVENEELFNKANQLAEIIFTKYKNDLTKFNPKLNFLMEIFNTQRKSL